MARILFVDDQIVTFDPDQQNDSPRHYLGPLGLYLKAIEKSGHQIERATGPGNAMSLLSDGKHFDLAVVDVMMPPESADSPYGSVFEEEATSFGLATGFNLAQELHRHDPQLPIVILSNIVSEVGADSAIVSQLLAEGVVVRVISKQDVRPRGLVTQLEEVLQCH